MIRIQIQLREDQIAYVKRIAAEDGVSMAEVIRQAVTLFQQTRQKSSKRIFMQQAVDVFNRGYASEIDISENHDIYLDEIYGM